MKKSYIVLFHIAYWLPNLLGVFTTIYILTVLPKWEKNAYSANIIFNIVSLIAGLFIFYLFYFFFFPRYLGNQKLNRFLMNGFIICLAVTIFGTVIDMQFGYLLGNKPQLSK